MKIVKDILKGICIAILVFAALMIALYLVFALMDVVYSIMEYIGIERTGERLQQDDIINILR